MKGSKIGLIAIGLLISIFILFHIHELTQAPKFFSYDPFYHFIFSEQIIESGIQPTGWANTWEVEEVPYITQFWTLFAVNSLISKINLEMIYRVGGVLMLSLSALLIFLCFKKRKTFSYIVTILFIFSGYLFWRGFISYPENLAVLLISLMIYGVRKNSKEIIFIAYIAYAYTHLRSLLFPTILLGYFMILNYKDIKKFIKDILIIILFLVPIIPKLLIQAIGYIHYHFGNSQKIFEAEQLLSRYNPISLTDFFKNISVILIIFGTISCIYLIYHAKSWKKLWIILMPIAAFILIRGDLFLINIPYYRMYSYMLISLTIVAIYSEYEFKNLSRFSKEFLIAATIISSLLAVTPIHGSLLINSEHIEMSNYLNSFENKIVIMETPEMKMLGVSKVMNNGSLINEIYKKNWNNKELLEKLRNGGYDSLDNYFVISNSKEFISDLDSKQFGKINLFKLESSSNKR